DVATWRRPLEPEGFEQRKFLAAGVAGLDREAAGRQSIALSFCQCSKITCAEKRADLVEIIRLVQRKMHTEAGETEVARRGWPYFAKIEHVGAVSDRSRL